MLGPSQNAKQLYILIKRIFVKFDLLLKCPILLFQQKRKSWKYRFPPKNFITLNTGHWTIFKRLYDRNLRLESCNTFNFLVRYDPRVVNYDRRLATGGKQRLMFYQMICWTGGFAEEIWHSRTTFSVAFTNTSSSDASTNVATNLTFKLVSS